MRPNQGIYQITCLPTGTFYIGSSVDVIHRWRNHKSSLRGDKHWNHHLQRAWNKYGEENFSFEIIQPVANSQNLHYIEEGWIRIKGAVELGFNMVELPAQFNTGRKSPGTGFKIWKTRRKNGNITSKNRRPVVGFNTKGERVVRFDCGKHAVQAGYKSVPDAIKKMRKSGGLFWTYEDDADNFDLGVYLETKITRADSAVSPRRHIYLDIETGIYYNSLKELAITLGISVGRSASMIRSEKYKNRYIRV